MFWWDLHWVLGFLLGIVSTAAICHVLLTKRDPRSALGWTLVCLLIPFGFVLYVLFGINRLAPTKTHWESTGFEPTADVDLSLCLMHSDIGELTSFQDLKKTGEKLSNAPLVGGCKVGILYDGTEAYPAMLEAIATAQRSIYMSTYIFGASGIGKQFMDALAVANERGVEVKVLIDGVGVLYSFPTAYRKLKKRRIHVALYFSPLKSWSGLIHLNLRNHRKILVVDGKVGFTGGMNIHETNMARKGKPAQIHDVHFRVEGPVVGFLQDVFLKAWYSSSTDAVQPVIHYDSSSKGSVICRGMASGPYQKYSEIQQMLCAAINAAEKNIRVMTPYFIVGAALSAAFCSAALRGVKVEIILPEKNNLSLVKGACEAMLPDLLAAGVKFYYRRGNFAHTKIFLMDDYCAFVGSSNIDVRSLYLNFEFNLEVYDRSVVSALQTHFETIQQNAREITLESLQRQNIVIRFRNEVLRLFSPYL